MNNSDNEHIDDLFSEENVQEEQKAEEKKSNYFNDYSGSENRFNFFDDKKGENCEADGEYKAEGKTDGAKGYFDYTRSSEKPSWSDDDNRRQGYLKGNDEQKFSALGKVSMALGIVSMLSCCFAGFPIFLACMAIILSAVRMSVKADGFSIAGLVMGIIGFLLNAIFLIAVIYGEADLETTARVFALVFRRFP